MARFDFVACEEPFDHSPDPLRDADVILEHLGRESVVLLAIPESHCAHRRRLMQQIVRQLSTTRDDMERHANEWFSLHVDATARRRGLSREAVLRDVFVSPEGRTVDLADVCALFRDRGMTYLGSNPRLGGHCRAIAADPFDYLAHRAHYRFLERLWATFGGDALLARETADPASLHRDVEIEFASLAAIANRVAQRDVDDVLIERLRACGDGFDHLVVLASR